MSIQMCAFHLLLTVDPSLGRLDYSLLSDQALMEMLIEGFADDNKRTYQDDHGMYLDVCEWVCVTCDTDERVIEIDIDNSIVSGTIELCYVPPKVKILHISSWGKSQLTGSVDLACLPDGMKVLCLKNNQLTGEIDLTHLSDGIEILSLLNNQLTGEVDLTQLPDGMKNLCLTKNQFCGEVDLTHLPDGMECLYLNNNQFKGEINLTQLPNDLLELHLQNNQLSGSLILKRLPPHIDAINVRGNKFYAVAVVDSETDAIIQLRGSGVTSVVDKNGKKLDTKRFFE